MPERTGIIWSIIILGIISPLRAQDPPVTPGSWTMVHFPDIQNYVSNPGGVQILNRQMEWVKASREGRNIRFGVQVGDLVNDNGGLQWSRARAAFNLLAGEVPYALCTGNHDCGPSGSGETRETLFSAIANFGTGSPYQTQETLKGVFEHPDDPPGNTQNSWHAFRAGGQNFLVLTCEWGPRNKVVAWMNDLAEAHPFHRVILVCHAYLASASGRFDWSQSQSGMNPHGFGINADPDKANDGQELWDKLVKRHENFCLVCCGHAGRGFRTATGANGNRVHEMLYNTQELANGGNGWIRLLEFLPDGRTVRARSYSTHLEEWDSSAAGAFQFTLSEVSKADQDSDGMPDSYEIQKGWPASSPENAAEDADGDGFTNHHEFIARTDPLNAASNMKITALANPGPSGLSIHWDSVPGVEYVIQETDSLETPASWKNLGSPVTAESFTSRSAVAMPGGKKFFRIAAVGHGE